MSTTQVHEIPTIDVVLVVVERSNGNSYALDTASKLQVEPQIETQDAIKLIVKGKLKAQKLETTTITGNKITLTDNVFSPELVEVLQGGTITYEKTYTLTVSNDGMAAGAYYFAMGDEYVTFTLDSALSDGDKIVFYDTGKLLVTKGGITSSVAYAIASSAPGTGTVISPTAATTSNIKSYVPPTAGSGIKGEVFTLHAYSAQYDTSGQIVQYERIDYPNCQGVPISMSSEDNVFRAPEYTINSAPRSDEAPYTINYVASLPAIS